MPAATRSLARPFADSSASTIVAGFIAMLTGYTSSLVLMFQAGQAAGLSSAQISSWIWALSIGMAICSIGLSMRYIRRSTAHGGRRCRIVSSPTAPPGAV